MHLKSLQIINFKNYEASEITLCDGINCFIGMNGAGKTNILDAVHYLSMCKSYLNTIDRQNIHFDQQFFSILGSFSKDDKDYDIHCAFKIGAKKVFKKNKKEYEKLAEHIGLFPTVIISPYDKDLISGGSELRRKWIDGIISQSDKDYLADIQKYAKILAQRNALLKHMYENGFFELESIDVWNEQLIFIGNRIHQKRSAFLADFIPVFKNHYNQIGIESDNVTIEFRSQLNEASFAELLKLNERKDAHSQYTNAGIHKDDLVFLIKGYPVKKFGSQGQQKSFVIALRLAQYDWLKQNLNIKPILLLDDIFDKLDRNRVQRLMDLVSSDFFGQVLVTDTDEERIRQTFEENNISGNLYLIANSTITKQPNIEHKLKAVQ
ncbi:MAG: DNA replication and repair protein RecF [Crocinitomicaceae bacterium]|nr:DNA replication and repair protein RecF [Crocinitomicaceae bacterium]